MKRIADWWFAPAPAERLAALRILIGGFALCYVIGRLPELVAVSRLPRSAFQPIGVVRLLDAPLPTAVVIAITVATACLLAAFVLGFGFRVCAPLAAAGLVWTLTYRCAWGQVFHTENLLVLDVIALACSPAADAWAIRARPRERRAGYGWAIKLMVALLAATYLMAGIAKLRLAGASWLDGDQLRNQIAMDNLRKALLGGPIAPLAVPMLAHRSAFTVFSIGSLVIELGAPLILIGHRVARVWAVAAWGFHVGVLLMMYIVFPFPLSGFAYLPLVPIERVVISIARECRRRFAG